MALSIFTLLSACLISAIWTVPKPDKNIHIHLDEKAEAEAVNGDYSDYTGFADHISLPAGAIVSDGNRIDHVDLSKVDEASLKGAAEKAQKEISNRMKNRTGTGNRRTPTLDGSNSGWGK